MKNIGFEIVHETGYQIALLIKLVGYTSLLKMWFKEKLDKTFFIALLRTGTGAFTGTLLFISLPDFHTSIPFYIGLTLLRAIEWLTVGKIFSPNMQKSEAARFIGAGIITSFILDIPVMAGYFITGGGIC